MGTMLDMRRTDVPFMAMATRTAKPLLAPVNEAEWARINEEEVRQEAEFAAGLTVPERLEFGQRLCDQAVEPAGGREGADPLAQEDDRPA